MQTIKTVSILLATILGLVSCSAITPDVDISETAFRSNASLAQAQSNLLNIDGFSFIDKAHGNCPVDALDMPGEGFRYSGASGGLTTTSLFNNNPEVNWPFSTGITANSYYFKNDYQLAKKNPRASKAAILIVDDFNKNTYRLGKSVFELDSASLSSQEKLEDYMAHLEKMGDLSHGALVLNHTHSIMSQLAQPSSLSNPNYLFYKGKDLMVNAVNVDDYNTDVIYSRTLTAIKNADAAGYKDIIINMSFAIVPCDVLSDFKKNRAAYPTFESYRDAIAVANNMNTSYGLDYLNALLVTPLANDPLEGLTTTKHGPSGKSDLHFIASSGNYGLEFPMYPAAFYDVMDVQSKNARNADGSQSRSFFSNQGDYTAIGAWHTLENVNGFNGSFGMAEKVMYAGTSFSAPMRSVLKAVSKAY